MTTNEISAQRIFDLVIKHLRKQGVASMSASMTEDDAAVCRYRGHNGAKCAIGCMISDDLYDPEIEGRPVGSICGRLPRGCAEHVFLLGQLQDAHDNCMPKPFEKEVMFSMSEWEQEMGLIASNFELSYTQPRK